MASDQLIKIFLIPNLAEPEPKMMSLVSRGRTNFLVILHKILLVRD